jgi:hypothetical protein
MAACSYGGALVKWSGVNVMVPAQHVSGVGSALRIAILDND